jgi:hypothetical protein
MALQSSGQIKLSEIAAEHGGTAPHSLSEYYGRYKADDSRISTSGDITASELYATGATVNGGWSAWGAYGNCSVSCGGGTQSHTRSCNNPSRAYGGVNCSGSTSESQSCNTQSCAVTFTTGSESSASTTFGSGVTLATGKIVTGYYGTPYNNGTMGIKYRTLTTANATINYGSLQSSTMGTCSGAGNFSYSDRFFAGGAWCSDGGVKPQCSTIRKYQPSSSVGTLTFGGENSTSSTNGGWVSIPGTSVSGASSVNVATGIYFLLGSGACARQPNNHKAYYRAISVTL